MRRKKQTCSPAPISPPRIAQWIVELLILTQQFHYRQYCRVTTAEPKVDCRFVLPRFVLQHRLPYLPSCSSSNHWLIVEDFDRSFKEETTDLLAGTISPLRTVELIVELLILTQRFHYRQYCRVTAAEPKVDCRFVTPRFFLQHRLPYHPSTSCLNHWLIVKDLIALLRRKIQTCLLAPFHHRGQSS